MSETGKISDGYHTFDELYEHRHMLFLALICELPSISWRSKLHQDGTMFEGWFIAGMNLPKFGQISYHLPMRLWPLLDGILGEAKLAPEWDGHSANDVVERLRAYIDWTGFAWRKPIQNTPSPESK